MRRQCLCVFPSASRLKSEQGRRGDVRSAKLLLFGSGGAWRDWTRSDKKTWTFLEDDAFTCAGDFGLLPVRGRPSSSPPRPSCAPPPLCGVAPSLRCGVSPPARAGAARAPAASSSRAHAVVAAGDREQELSNREKSDLHIQCGPQTQHKTQSWGVWPLCSWIKLFKSESVRRTTRHQQGLIFYFPPGL